MYLNVNNFIDLYYKEIIKLILLIIVGINSSAEDIYCIVDIYHI